MARHQHRALLTSVAFAGFAMAPTWAQDGAEAVEDVVIVTGTAKPTTQFESSYSVTALEPDQIERAAPRSTAELFRALPGIQVEPSSGDANTNLKVRGLPISAGGSRYVSFQEDGFPTLLVGDVAFATADSFIRYDTTIANVQSIRGGTASTLAPNAPGGIINLISKDGSEKGGAIAFTAGVDFDSYRADFEYGMPFNDNWSGHVGGFYRTGEGAREAASDIEEGYQIKATLAGNFDRGSIKVHVKRLDDTVPTYLPIPARFNGGRNFSEVGVDFGDGTLFADLVDFASRPNGVTERTDQDGFSTEVTTIGVVADYDVTDFITVGAKHRSAFIEGQFRSPFLNALSDNPAGGVDLTIVNFNTLLPDFDNRFTNFYVTGRNDNFGLTVGVDIDRQNINSNWFFSEQDITLNPDGSQTELARRFTNDQFGNCCSREYDAEIESFAPYVAFDATFGDLTFEASYRDNNYDVTGTFDEDGTVIVTDVDGDGDTEEFNTVDTSNERSFDYESDFDAWSVGVNYALTGNWAIFANISEGGSLSSPDRITGSINPDGSASNTATFSAVEQYEMGVKYASGPASLAVTYFNTEVEESLEFEVTTQSFRGNSFETEGLEVEGAYDFGNGFGLTGNFTLTDAEITTPVTVDATTGAILSGAVTGNTPRRQAPYIFNISPYYENERFNVGMNVFGTGPAFIQDSNDARFDSYTVVSLNGNYFVTDRLDLGFAINNLFDSEGFTEGEEGAPAIGDLVRIRPINGRTTSVRLRYTF